MVTLSDFSRPILRVEVLGGKIPYSIEMADNSPFLFAGPLGGLVTRKRLHFSTPFTNNNRNSQQNTPEEYHQERPESH